MSSSESYSENVEMYLKTIFLLGKEGDGKAKTWDISKELSVAPSSVTEMLERLHEEGYVRHRKYYGASLTKKGDAYARRLLRKHCVLEWFLVKTLDYPRGRFHDEACRMEHAISDETAKRLAKLVDLPEECPDCYDRRKEYCTRLLST